MDLDPSPTGALGRSRRRPKPSNKAAEAEKDRQEKELQKKARGAAHQKQQKNTKRKATATASNKTKDSQRKKSNPTQDNFHIRSDTPPSQAPASTPSPSETSLSATCKGKAVQMGITPHIWSTFSLGVKQAIVLSFGCSIREFEEGVLESVAQEQSTPPTPPLPSKS